MSNQKNQQAQLEQAYAQQQNFFFESITQKLKDFKETPDICFELINTIVKGKPLTVKQFELIGGMSYLVGIDYCNQLYVTKQISQNVVNRFKNIGFPSSIVELYLDAINIIDESMIEDAKSSLKDSVAGSPKISTENKLVFEEIKIGIKTIVKNSYLPVNMAVSADELLKTKNLTYQDFLKINSLLNRQCKFNGQKAIKAMIKLYGNQVWRDLLTTASKYFDNQKFAVVYLDSIISVKESKNKVGDLLGDVLFERITDEQFEKFESCYNNQKLANVAVEETLTENVEKSYVRLADDVVSYLQENNPLQFLIEVLSDLVGSNIKTSEGIFVALDKLFENEDFAQNVYHYVKANEKKAIVKDENDIFVNETLIGIFEDKLTKLGSEYKVLAEKICSTINPDYLTKIVNYVNSCIGDLILITDEQKQYLISQTMENGISTYQHLSEMIEMIEGCDINGNNILSYVVLNQYLSDNTELSDIFEASQQINPIQLKLSFYAGFADFFKAALNNSETDTAN